MPKMLRGHKLLSYSTGFGANPDDLEKKKSNYPLLEQSVWMFWMQSLNIIVTELKLLNSIQPTLLDISVKDEGTEQRTLFGMPAIK